MDGGDFEKVESGASATFPKQVGALKKGDLAMLKDKPCKVMEISCAKTGKHGHAKATIVGIDIFTGKKYEDSYPTSHSCEVPFADRKEYSLTFIDGDGFVTLLDADSNTRNDLRLPTEEIYEPVVAKIKQFLDEGKEMVVQVLKACGEEKIVEVRESNSDSKK